MAFSVETAAWANPSAVSPRTVVYSGRAGRLYIAVLARSTAGDPFMDVIDNAGNLWTYLTHAPTSGGVGRRIELWACIPTTPFSELVVSFSGGGTAYVTLVEITGHDPAYLDQVASVVRSGSTAPARLEVTPGADDVLALAAVHANANTDAQITSAPGWTRLPTNALGPSIAYRTDTLSGVPVGVDWTLELSLGSGHAIATILPGGEVTPPGLTVTVWDGTTELPAVVAGVWDGSTIQPAVAESVV